MEETKTQCKGPDCEECKKREVEERRNEEVSMSFLVALMPLLTMTLFNNMGLF